MQIIEITPRRLIFNLEQAAIVYFLEAEAARIFSDNSLKLPFRQGWRVVRPKERDLISSYLDCPIHGHDTNVKQPYFIVKKVAEA